MTVLGGGAAAIAVVVFQVAGYSCLLPAIDDDCAWLCPTGSAARAVRRLRYAGRPIYQCDR